MTNHDLIRFAYEENADVSAAQTTLQTAKGRCFWDSQRSQNMARCAAEDGSLQIRLRRGTEKSADDSSTKK